MTEADGSFSIFPIYCQRETLSKTNIQLIKKMDGVSLSLDRIDLYVSWLCYVSNKNVFNWIGEKEKKDLYRNIYSLHKLENAFWVCCAMLEYYNLGPTHTRLHIDV